MTPRRIRLYVLAVVLLVLAWIVYLVNDRVYYKAVYTRSVDTCNYISGRIRELTGEWEDAKRTAVKMPFYRYLIEAYSVRYPDFHRIVSIAYDAAIRHGLDPYLVLSIIHVESNFDPFAISHMECYGLMQLNPGAWKLDMSKIFDPAYNIDNGCRIFKLYLTETSGNIALALYRYNNGYVINGNTRYAGDVMGGKFNRGAAQ